jgi:hypothetical protein
MPEDVPGYDWEREAHEEDEAYWTIKGERE